ncbi:MAG: nickel pincer cofactor biosynthesis protein LarC [Verrucomicrobiota bacterium]
MLGLEIKSEHPYPMHLYLDPSLSGISGDMFLGACIDLGLDAKHLENELKKLGLTEAWELIANPSERCAVTGTKLDFKIPEHSHSEHHHHHDHGHSHDHDHTHHHGHGRHFTTIKKLIEDSELKPSVKTRAIAVFRRLGEAEAAIHGKTLEDIHFHEVGAVDSILDIVGACIALDLLDIETIRAAAPVDGHGTIECAHGSFPVPAPATLRLLKGIPLEQIDVKAELITPTGAALLAELVESFGPLGSATIDQIGYGLGQRELPNRPNALRALLYQPAAIEASTPFQTDTIQLLESNLDDTTGEVLGNLITQLMEKGALDAVLVPILMKKGRPGHQLQVMCEPAQAKVLAEHIFRTTGTLGLRVRPMERWKLDRQIKTVDTPYGPIRVKEALFNGEVLSRKPEADDVQNAAKSHQVTSIEVCRTIKY